MRQQFALARQHAPILAGLTAPLALTAILIPFRTSLPNTDAALVLILIVVAVAAFGSRPAGFLAGINLAAEAAAGGGSAAALIDDVARRLARLLSVRDCRFEHGVAGLGRPARLQHDGQVVTADQRVLEVEQVGLPATTELLVENRGVLRGRFVLTAEPGGARPTLEQRLVAVAFADQVGAALATDASVRPGVAS
jgi:hypothetical protein